MTKGYLLRRPFTGFPCDDSLSSLYINYIILYVIFQPCINAAPENLSSAVPARGDRTHETLKCGHSPPFAVIRDRKSEPAFVKFTPLPGVIPIFRLHSVRKLYKLQACAGCCPGNPAREPEPKNRTTPIIFLYFCMPICYIFHRNYERMTEGCIECPVIFPSSSAARR